MRSFNERSGASSSESGGEFECRVSNYLALFFFLGGVTLAPSGGGVSLKRLTYFLDLL